mmetsp:Transcript_17088/g.37366  ORF Transcript_17088/g.37366 Transcript_17088/m.37366 type:complete len:273 (+) Transcript_17088:210-1028(+)
MEGTGQGTPRANQKDGRKSSRPAHFRRTGRGVGRRPQESRSGRGSRRQTRLVSGRQARLAGGRQRAAGIHGLPPIAENVSGNQRPGGHGPRGGGKLGNLPGLRSPGLRGGRRGREGKHRTGLVGGRSGGDLRVRRGTHDALQPAKAKDSGVRAPRSGPVQDNRRRRPGRRDRLVRHRFQWQHPAFVERRQRSPQRAAVFVPGGGRPRQGTGRGRGTPEHAGGAQKLQAGSDPAQATDDRLYGDRERIARSGNARTRLGVVGGGVRQQQQQQQ